ncbi:MAG TPA: hemerythrin domain-containing protein [Steroidobacteraceae bacterium]|nr:hemerythrin domain-containing protein [Steroidobacteraceae bacterium]
MKTKSKAKAARLKSEAFAKAKRVAPRQAIHIGSTPSTRFRGDAAIFGRLVEDHDRHRALFSMIEASERTSSDRAKLFRELVHEIKGHAAAEEQALWSTVLRHPESTDAGRHAVAEHKKIDDHFADLAARDMKLKGWLRRFGEAKKLYLHHIREEEQEQFVESQKVLTLADQRYMRGVFNRRKREEKAKARVTPKIKLK